MLLRRLIRSAQPGDQLEWNGVWDELQTESFLSRTEIRFCREINSPIVSGIRHRMILIPEALREIDDRTMIRHVLIHERTHLQRRDTP